MKFARFAVSLFVLAFLVSRAAAADWPPINLEELSMTGIPEQPGAPAVILDREVIADHTNQFYSVYARIKILNDAGREYAIIELPYLHRYLTVSGISGRTIHSDGTIVAFTGKPFDKTVVKGPGLRYKVKAFTLPDVQVGSVIEYRFDYRYPDTEYLPPPYWIIQDDLFQKTAYFKFIPYQRTTYGIGWTSYLPATQPQPQSLHSPFIQNEVTRTVHSVSNWVELRLTNVPAFIKEPNLPPSDMLKWRVAFYYRREANPAPEHFWKDVGKLWNKECENFVSRNKGVREMVGQITAPTDSPEQKVRKIYTFVSKLENRDYFPERTEQEEKALKIKPLKSADEVLQSQSGTHDDLNRLFVSMVRAAGLPARLIWVPDRSDEIFDQFLMSTWQLDAEIAVVRMDGKEVHLDPGSKFCPYGLVNWRYTAVSGLRQLEGKGAEIAQTPSPDYKQARITRLANLSLENGTLSGTVALSWGGMEAMIRRQEGGTTDASGRKKLLDDEVKDILPGNADVILINTPDWENPESSLDAEFRVSVPFGMSAGKRLMVMQHLFQVNEKPQFTAIERGSAVYFHFPWQEADEIHIQIPAGMEAENFAPNDDLSLGYAVYRTVQKKEAPDKIFARRDFIMGTMLVAPEKYKEIKNFFDKVKDDDGQPTLVKAAPHVAAN
jgi:transglutaminase-like putative cysteine protease